MTSHKESGKNATKEYRCWSNMKYRCYNPNYKGFHNYGQLGIKVCDRWLAGYENFLADMGRAPGPEYTLDRIDVYWNYTPDNCRWATIIQQNRNKKCNKLSIERATKIRELYASGNFTQKDLARIYDTNISDINWVINNKLWKEN